MICLTTPSARVYGAIAVACLTLACSVGALAQSPPTPAYTVVKTVPLGAPDRWDYVFYGPFHRVYVAHGDRVNVVDGQSGALIGDITGMPGGAHGIAVSKAAGKGYTDDGKAGQVAVFDLKTLQVVKRIDAKPDADGMVFDETSGHIFVVDGDSKVLTVIDPATDGVVATVDAGEGLEAAVSGGNGKIYVNGAENKELLRVDVKTNAVDARWPIPGCASPHGLALDKAAHRAFVSCVNKVMTVVDTDSGAVLASLPIGQGTDSAAFDPKRKLAFSSNGDGTLSIIREVDPQTFVLAGMIKTAATGRTMDIDPQTGRLYIAAADIDHTAQTAPAPGGRPGRPRIVPGSLKLLFLDPAQ
jgi:YVTN family beta-propeller protein